MDTWSTQSGPADGSCLLQGLEAQAQDSPLGALFFSGHGRPHFQLRNPSTGNPRSTPRGLYSKMTLGSHACTKPGGGWGPARSPHRPALTPP